LISINFTLFAQIIHFLVLVWIFNRLLIRPVLKNLRAKEIDLAGRRESIDGIRQESADREKDYLERLRQARSETMAERDKLLEQAREEADQVRKKAMAESASFMTKVREDLDSSLAEVRRTLKSGEEGLVRQLTEAVLGRKA
jgi:F-type H+-transporting ATPase subunit b